MTSVTFGDTTMFSWRTHRNSLKIIINNKKLVKMAVWEDVELASPNN